MNLLAEYSLKTQSQIILVYVALYNFIRAEKETDDFEDIAEDSTESDIDDFALLSVNITHANTRIEKLRDEIVNVMWLQY